MVVAQCHVSAFMGEGVQLPIGVTCRGMDDPALREGPAPQMPASSRFGLARTWCLTTPASALMASAIARRRFVLTRFAPVWKWGYRSLQVVQAVAWRAERGTAVGRYVPALGPSALLSPAAQVIEAGRAICPAGDERSEHLR
jgi:hypothetical protein